MNQPVLDAIYKRRSIREFSDEEVIDDDLREIVRAGIWAPSGLNNQPWRFVIVKDDALREQLSQTTHYSHIVQASRALIAVFLDRGDMYDDLKDAQAAGACIQNMLLAVEALGLGAVWLGQILKSSSEVKSILAVEDDYDLMAVLAIGHPAHHRQNSKRKDLEHFILGGIR